jgi:hypothetical protein
MHVPHHVWRTADGRYVPTGHPDAAVLAHAAGDDVADSLAHEIGLAAYLGEGAAASGKSAGKPQDKAAPRPADKSRTLPAGK